MPYRKLLVLLVLSFMIMYTVMFLNVDSTDHVYFSLTRTYMSLLMVSHMALLMPLFMRKMYPDKRLNAAIISLSILVFILSFVFLRRQTFIGDQAYMKAMIPHHSSAILTSKHATIKDPEVRALADQIIKSQEEEIAQMKNILERMGD